MGYRDDGIFANGDFDCGDEWPSVFESSRYKNKDDDDFADGDYDLGDDDYRDYLSRVNSGREDDYDRYDDRQERLEQANFRRDVLNERYDRILGIIFGDDDDLFL